MLIARQLASLLNCTDFINYLSSPDEALPTKESLLARASESVTADVSLCVSLKCQTVLLASRGLLLEEGHVISHMTHLLTALAQASEVLSAHSHATTEQDQIRVKCQAGMSKSRQCTARMGSLRLTKVDLTNLNVTCLRAELHLLLWQPEEALGLVNNLLPRLEGVCFCADHMSLWLSWAQLLFLKGKSLSQKINGCQHELASQEVWLASNSIVRECVSVFGRCYDVCVRLCPVVLLREVCLWLAFLAKKEESLFHYFNTAQQISLSHTSSFILGNKIE